MLKPNTLNAGIFRVLALGILVSVLAGFPIPSQAQENEVADLATTAIDFEHQILPILRQHCFGCHGPQRQESNFRLDLKHRALAIADFGDPPIVAGDSQASPLIQFVTGEQEPIMPPAEAGTRLSESQIDQLRCWIDQGANWPDKLAGDADERIQTQHWSFQPLTDPPVPQDAFWNLEAGTAVHGIDAFVGNQLREQGLQPSPPADPVTRIRRLYLDMHGLLPTERQVQAFLAKQSPEAWPNLVDEVLESHHYGERWARHWLDVVRFGESTGYEVNRDRSNAWYYRDYVIEALNQDKSYRDFLIEQLAGDSRGIDEATGFLVGGAHDIVKSPDINLTLMQRQDELADFVNTACTTFLGLTVGCARCHNHKFDPILQKDYYALQAVFAGVEHGERPLLQRADPEIRHQLTEAENTLQEAMQQVQILRKLAAPVETEHLLPAVNARLNTDSFDPVPARYLRFTVRATNQAEPCLDELEVFGNDDTLNLALAASGSRVTSSGSYAGNPKHQLAHIHDGRFGNDHSWISDTPGKGWVQIEFPTAVSVARVVWARDRQGTFSDRLPIVYSISVSQDGESWRQVASSHQRAPFLVDGQEPEFAFVARLPDSQKNSAAELVDSIAELRARISQWQASFPTAYVGQFRKPPVTHRLHRGDPLTPREAVAPDTIEVLGSLGLPQEADEQVRRLRLAEWMASDDNPLTARVIVNRVWHYHFGRGLVATPSDLGKAGALPSHPQLLDWLACRFMEHGWSLKWLHRQILTSATWQQSSQPRSAARAVDAEGRWLWRFPPRRLEAEAIRDCILQVSGKLNRQVGGPGFLLFEVDRENVHHYFPLQNFGPQHFRRMVYMTKIRQEQDDVFGAFDCPDGGQTIPQRTRSTTPLQALNLLNSPFILQQAGFLAERLREEAGVDPAAQVRQAFQWAYQRDPTPEELKDVVAFIGQQGLEAFCRVLWNTNEFLFIS